MNLNFFENKYFFAIFAIFSAMYAFQIKPNLPNFLIQLFQNAIFRVLILFLILVRGYKDVQFSILVAGAFVIIMDTTRQQVFKETFTQENQGTLNNFNQESKLVRDTIIAEGILLGNKNVETIASEISKHYSNERLIGQCDQNQRILNEISVCKSLWFNKDPNSVTYKNITEAYNNISKPLQTCFDNNTINKNTVVYPPNSKGIMTSAIDCATKYGQ
jgi:hypothetical protein